MKPRADRRAGGSLLFSLSLAIASAPCLAGGTLGTNELQSILRQQPGVYDALMASLELPAGEQQDAERIEERLVAVMLRELSPAAAAPGCP